MRKLHLLAPILITLMAGLLLAALNPRQADFKAYLGRQARAAMAVEGSDAFDGLGSSLGSLAAEAFTRKDYGILSSYSIGSRGPVYLGIAKLFFKIK